MRDQAAGTDDDEDDVTIADLEAGTTMDFEVTRDDDDEASTLEIKAVVTSVGNPFESVIFYAAADNDETDGDMKDLRFIASVPEYSARENGGEWTYTARVSADDFYAAVGGDDSYSGKVSAVGVRAAGSVDAEGTETTVTVVTTIEGTMEMATKTVVETDEDGGTAESTTVRRRGQSNNNLNRYRPKPRLRLPRRRRRRHR